MLQARSTHQMLFGRLSTRMSVYHSMFCSCTIDFVRTGRSPRDQCKLRSHRDSHERETVAPSIRVQICCALCGVLPWHSHLARVGTLQRRRDSEFLVKVSYAGINGGCETFRARGEGFYTANKNKKGFGFGAEGSGVVVRSGPGAALRAGTSVAFLSDGQTFSEYVTVPASYCTAVAKASAEACAVRISGVTANNAINIKLQAQRQETVLITGAAGGTGNLAVQLALLNGCRVIGTCGSERKAALLRRQGVQHVINYRETDLAQALQKIAPTGVDCCLEGVGGRTLRAALQHLKPDGRLCVLGYISQYPHNRADADRTTFDFDGMGLEDFFWRGKSVLRGDQRIYGNVFVNYALSFESRADTFQLFEQHKIQPVIDDKEWKGLDAIPDAVDYMLSGQSMGKVVVRIA